MTIQGIITWERNIERERAILGRDNIREGTIEKRDYTKRGDKIETII